jgi:hypothetical protein
MTYLNDTEIALDSFTSHNDKLDKRRTFALAAQADEQRTANLIAIMNSARISPVKQNQIRDIVLKRLGIPNTELTAFDEEED